MWTRSRGAGGELVTSANALLRTKPHIRLHHSPNGCRALKAAELGQWLPQHSPVIGRYEITAKSPKLNAHIHTNSHLPSSTAPRTVGDAADARGWDRQRGHAPQKCGQAASTTRGTPLRGQCVQTAQTTCQHTIDRSHKICVPARRFALERVTPRRSSCARVCNDSVSERPITVTISIVNQSLLSTYTAR